MKKNILLFLLSASIQYGFAQNHFGLLNESKHNISLGMQANPILNINTDYNLNFSANKKNLEKFGFIANLNFPLFTQQKFDFDLRLGSSTLVGFSKKFKMISGITWGLSRTADINANYIHSGFKMDILPGYYGEKWVFASHLSMNYQPWMNIQHNDNAKQAFTDLYPNGNGTFTSPKDGWFYQNNILFQTGLGIAYRQPMWQLNVTAGFQYQPNSLGLISFPDIGIMPFYGGVNFLFAVDNICDKSKDK